MSKVFNGTTDLINLGSPVALDDIGGVNGPRSIWAWIYPTGWGEGNFGRIWDKGTFLTTGWFFYLKNDAAPTATFEIAIGGTTGAFAIAATSTLALNVWRFVAATWAGTIGTNAPKLFVGSLSSPVAEVSYDSSGLGAGTQGSDAAATAYIGNRGAADRTFAGNIACLGLADQALTVAQLDLLRLFPYAPMHRFSVGGTVVNLKGYYPMWESAAATCLDHSGNGNNGTVTGTSVGAEPPYTFTRRGTRATIWTPAVAGGRIWSLAGKGGGLVWTPRGLAH